MWIFIIFQINWESLNHYHYLFKHMKDSGKAKYPNLRRGTLKDNGAIVQSSLSSFQTSIESKRFEFEI